MKIVTILGARPQFVKAAVLSRLIKDVDSLKEIILHTGQHFDQKMSDVFFEEMNIPKPDYNLSISGGNHGAMTGRMLEEIEKVLIAEKPDLVLVYGDTNSTLAGALAAKKLHMKLAHVEAGLRSFNMEMPEEINRVLTDRISDLLFCPTDTARINLEREGFGNFDGKLITSGDVMLDAVSFYKERASKTSTILEHLGLNSGEYTLATIHRAENTNSPLKLKEIVSGFNRIAKDNRLIVPLHPRTSKLIKGYDLTVEFEQLDPVGYFDMIVLCDNASHIITDSGGLQKEAFFLEKPCLTIRDQTEWTELLEMGVNKLVAADANEIVEAYNQVKTEDFDFSLKPYGEGKAGENILAHLIQNN